MTNMLVMAARVCLMAVFATAVVSKGRRRSALAEFARSLADLQLVRPRWSWITAASVVLAEAAIVVLLAVPDTARVGSVIAGLLVICFTVALAMASRRNPKAQCPCFGKPRIAGQTSGHNEIIRNTVLAVFAMTGTFPVDAFAVAPAAVATAAAAGLLAAVLIICFDDLIALARPATTRPRP